MNPAPHGYHSEALLINTVMTDDILPIISFFENSPYETGSDHSHMFHLLIYQSHLNCVNVVIRYHTGHFLLH